MKLKFATKTFIVSNAFLIFFRSLQIMFLTESETGFLKNGFTALNVFFTVIAFIIIAYTALNSYFAIRQPLEVNSHGKPTAVAAGISGLFLCISSGSLIVNHGIGWKYQLLFSLLSALCMFLFAASSLFDYKFPKVAPLALIALCLSEFLVCYVYSSEHPLRVRTVYEVFSISTCLLFYLVFGKTVSGVSKAKNFKIMYPLGFVSSIFSFAASVPELIATALGFSEKVSSAAISPFITLGNAIFITAVTLNTFKKSNTVRPTNHH